MDRTAPIKLQGGLDEVSSDFDVNPGAVRRSINYEVVADGGYRRIGGRRPWSGLNLTPRYDAVKVYETSKINQEGPPEKALVGAEYRVLCIVQRTNSTLVVVEMKRATQTLYLGDRPLGAGSEIINVAPQITIEEQNEIFDLITGYGSEVAYRMFGAGPIDLVIEHDNTLYGFRDSADHPGEHWIQRANVGDDDQWQIVGRYPVPDGTEGTQWEGYSYQFAGRLPELFVVNGRSYPIRIIRDEAGGDYWFEINDETTVAPNRVIVYRDHLMLAYPGGEVRYSALGDPRNFSADAVATLGAGSFSVGATVTAWNILPNGSLAIYCKDKISILSGTNSSEFNLSTYTDDSGAIEGTVQEMPNPIFCDSRGITALTASDAPGNFTSKALSQKFDPTYQRIRQGGRLFSCINRAKSQYRVINEDGRGLFLTFSGSQLAGGMEVDLGMKVSAMGTLGDDCFVASSSSGILYQMDSGARFFDSEFVAFIELPQLDFGSPRSKKRFKQADFEAEGDPRASLKVTNIIDDGIEMHEDTVEQGLDIESRNRPRYRDDLLSRFSQPFKAVAYLIATGLSQSLRVRSTSGHEHTLRSVVVHFKNRGQRR